LNRCKWRDKQANEAYWTLVLAQKTSCPANLTSMDAMLKRYYSPALVKAAAEIDNARFSIARKLGASLWR
jgi:hypothetical protein